MAEKYSIKNDLLFHYEDLLNRLVKDFGKQISKDSLAIAASNLVIAYKIEESNSD